MSVKRSFTPDPKLQTKMVLWIMSVLVFLVMPWILLGFAPGLGWWYVIVFLVVNAAWVVVGLALVPLYYRSISYHLDEDAVLVRKGIITKTEQMVPYRTITNIEMKRGIFDRWLGLGTIAIHTAGYSQQTTAEAKLVGLTDYQRVREELVAALRRYRGAAEPGIGVGAPAAAAPDEPAQLLRQLLDEVRAMRGGAGRP
ncbi:MAG: PH domain-containing protein [Chloroflexota bacterium]